MTSSPVGMRCPECAGERTRVRSGASIFAGSQTAYATYTLIAINVIVFLAELGRGGGAGSFSGGGGLIHDGGLFGPAIANQNEYYRIVTSGFLHAGPIHLLFNMFALYVLGTLLEPAVGRARFLGIYFASLLAGSFGALLLTPNEYTVGASGAVFGIFAAAFVIARGRGIQGVAGQIGLILLLNVVFTFSVPGLSIGGHLGGIIGGGLAALLVVWSERHLGGRQGAIVEGAGILAISLVSIAGALAVA